MKREVASLTKMMTALTVMKLIKKFKIDPKETFITVQLVAAEIDGTTANLKEGD